MVDMHITEPVWPLKINRFLILFNMQQETFLQQLLMSCIQSQIIIWQCSSMHRCLQCNSEEHESWIIKQVACVVFLKTGAPLSSRIEEQSKSNGQEYKQMVPWPILNRINMSMSSERQVACVVTLRSWMWEKCCDIDVSRLRRHW